MSGKDVMKGVYRERYGKCESKTGDNGGVDPDADEEAYKWVVREEKNDRCKFQMSMKLEKTEVSSARSSRGCGVSNAAMIGVRKY